MVYYDYLIRGLGLPEWKLLQLIRAGDLRDPLWKWLTILVLLAGLLLVARSLRFLSRAFVATVLFTSFAVFAALTLVNADDATASLTLGSLTRYLVFFIICPLLTATYHPPPRLVAVTLYFAIAGSALGLLLLRGEDVFWQALDGKRLAAGYSNPTGTAEMYLFALYFSFLLNGVTQYRESKGVALAALERAALLLACVIVILTVSRGPLVALAASSVLYWGLRGRWRRRPFVPLFACVVVVGALAYYYEALLLFATRMGTIELTAGRAEIWQDFVALLFRSPETLLFGGEAVAFDTPPHNVFLGTAMHYGIVGLVAYLSWHAYMWYRLVAVTRRLHLFGVEDIGHRALAVMAGIFLLANFGNTFYLNISLPTFLYYYVAGTLLISWSDLCRGTGEANSGAGGRRSWRLAAQLQRRQAG